MGSFENTNFFQGVSDNFSKGISDGQQYAQARLQADTAAQQLQFQRDQHNEVKKQHQFEMGKSMIDYVEKAIKMPAGNGQNEYLKVIDGVFKQYDYDNTKMLQALIKDPAGQAKFKAAFSQLYELSPQQQQELIAQAPQFLTDTEVNEHLTKFMEKSAELKKMKTEADLKQNGKPEAPHVLAQSNAVQNVTKDLDRVKVAIGGMDRMASKKEKGKVSYLFDKMTPADDFQFVKAFNQLNDTAAVREGEFATVVGLQGLADWAKTWVENKKEGAKLSPPLRQKIYNTSKKIESELNKSVKNKLMPLYHQVEEQGTPHNQVFGPDTLDVLESEVTDWEDVKIFADEEDGAPLAGGKRPGESRNAPPKPKATPAPGEVQATGLDGSKVAGSKEDVLRKYNPKLVDVVTKVLQNKKIGNSKKKAQQYAKDNGFAYPEDLLNALGAE